MPGVRKVAIAATTGPAAGRAVLASLPRSFVLAEAADAEVVVVDGRLPGWPGEVSADRQVVVVDPCPVEGFTQGAPFLLDTPWGSNPACALAADALRVAAWKRLECRSVVGSGTNLRHELLRLACLVRAVGVAVTLLRLLFSSADGLAALGRSGDRTVDFSVTVTEALPAAAHLRALTADGGIELAIPGGGTAAPAELVVTDASGAHLAPTLWENGHRATWRQVLKGSPPDDSAGFAADLELITAAFMRKETQ